MEPSGCGAMCWRLIPAYESETAIRIEFFGDEVDRITEIDILTGEIKDELKHVAIFPASHYVVDKENIKRAVHDIEEELDERVKEFKRQDKLLEAQRIAEGQILISDAQGDGILLGNRELFPSSGRACAGAAAVYTDRLFPG